MEVQAWGVGVFENQDALDWLDDLVDSEDLQAIMLALTSVVELSGTGELDSIDCCIALAAAEIVAASGDKPDKELPVKAKRFVNKMNIAVAAPVQELALNAMEIVRTRGKLIAHWKSSGMLGDWLAVMEDLEARLKSIEVAEG